MLRFYEDLSEQDAARELAVPVGTVKSTTHRALRKLRVDPDIRALAPQAN